MDSPQKSPESTSSPDPASALIPLVYEELRRIAAVMLQQSVGAGSPAVTIQPTALVHEAFLRLADQRNRWDDINHFRAIASIALRRVLGDYVRSRSAAKRGRGKRGITFHAEVLGVTSATSPESLHIALEDLERASPRVATLVTYRFLGGLSVDQCAARMGISVSTAEADWRFARVWLRDRMRELEE